MEICNQKNLLVIEFFSGVGGMHQAINKLSKSEINIHKIYPFDVNPNANVTYLHNFGIKPNEMSIENFTLNDYRQLCKSHLNEMKNRLNKADLNHNLNILWVMSPPCQPFTRLGNKKDLEDPRSKAFKHILNLLGEIELEYLPENILLENVKNFEESEACSEFLKILNLKGYKFLQFLLSPTQIGIPNNRLRYYLTAKLDKYTEKVSFTNEIIKSPEIFIKYNLINNEQIKTLELKTFLNYNKSDENYNKDLLVPMSVLSKESSFVVDLVTINSNSTNCFTKGYGRFLKGSGSLLLLDESFQETKFTLSDLKGSVRFFSPQEICKLMSFNEEFSFPNTITLKSKYKLLGNSVNVKVITLLLRFLLFHFE